MTMFALALAATAAAAQPMTAGDFLARAQPLAGKSPITLMFSSEGRALAKTITDAAQQTRARLDAERAAGKPMTTCLPPRGKAKVDARELVAYIRALAPQQRSQSFDAAFNGYVVRKYPCR